MPNILPAISVVYTSDAFYGVTQLGVRSHSTGSFEPEAITITYSFYSFLTSGTLTVASYINKQGGTHSHTLLHLVVDLSSWLQTQGIAIRARNIPGCLNVISRLSVYLNQISQWSLHPEIMNRIFGTWLTPSVDTFATVSNTHLPQFMSPIPELRALA